MTASTRQLVLRVNALYLGVAGIAGLLFMDIRGVYFGAGPVARLIELAPHSAIGFVEAHGLAAILAIVLWRATAERFWHIIAMAAEVLLGTANLVFWQIFVDGNALATGYVTTTLHWTFVAAQLVAAVNGRAKVALTQQQAS